MNQKRDISLDTISGIMILLIVSIHISTYIGVINPLENFVKLLYFFMPWFFYKSGMFHKDDLQFSSLVRKKFYRLLVPFIFFSILPIAISFVSKLCSRGLCISVLKELAFSCKALMIDIFVTRGYPVSNSSLWFLFGLFFVMVLSFVLTSYKWKALGGTLGLLIAYLQSWLNLPLPRYVPYVGTGLFFYVCGYFLRDRQYEAMCRRICLITFVLIFVFCYSTCDMVLNQYSGNCLMWGLSSVSGCVLFCNFCRTFQLKWTKLYLLGKYSMIIYLIHVPMLWYIVPLFDKVGNKIVLLGILCLMILLFSVLSVVCLKNKLVKFVFGM